MSRPPLELVKGVARAIADGLGNDFDNAHEDKRHWVETSGMLGGHFRDVNEPRQDDYLAAAACALEAANRAGWRLVSEEMVQGMLGRAG